MQTAHKSHQILQDWLKHSGRCSKACSYKHLQYLPEEEEGKKTNINLQFLEHKTDTLIAEYFRNITYYEIFILCYCAEVL